MPSMRIIVLDRQVTQEQNLGNEAPQIWRYALWADVPVARQPFYANPTATSAFKDIVAGDLTAIRDGSVTESVRIQYVPAGTGLAAVQSILQAKWTAYQAEVTTYNPWNRYGTFWDGASWTAGGVA